MEMLNEPLVKIKGIGAKRAQLLAKLGLCSIRDMLYFLPRDYQDFSECKQVLNVRHGEYAAIMVRAAGEPRVFRVRKNLSITTLAAYDETGNIALTWYNQPFRKIDIQPGETLIACGRVNKSHGAKLINPSIHAELPGILPVYPLVQGLSQKQLRDGVKAALDMLLDSLEETLPRNFRASHALCEMNFALANIHFPMSLDAMQQARRRLVFEEMLGFLIMLEKFKTERKHKRGISFSRTDMAEFLDKFPFEPTGAQRKVLEEIEHDMNSATPMNRLLQGDVGSGKTLLALYVLYVAVKNGYQAVIMAPTEILAQQHYKTMKRLFGEDAALITGSMKKSERDELYMKIKSGMVKAIAGTHALIQEGLEFYNLGAVVTDEQHRFGVRQRALISAKGCTPDVLIMSATPIPRTLALMLYGDLDVSVLDELPPGRKPVTTKFVPAHKRNDMYKFIEKRALEGKQAYVVCPLVEQSDMLDARSATDVYKELTALMKSAKVGLIHGQMNGAKKQQVLDAFRNGEIQVLVSTTVIEVGVDVPNATIMVIENADRFGLAQLHQLRGRIGRGEQESYCFLLTDSDSQSAAERLDILTKTQNGFEVAQKDLEFRGPGEFLGTRQHGLSELSMLKLASCMEVLREAQNAAHDLLRTYDTDAESKFIVDSALRRYDEKLYHIAQN